MNLLDLFVKIGVEDNASSQVSKIGGAIGKGLKTACKVGVAAVGAAATAIGALGTEAIKSYANYEQLVGGVETLFGLGGQTLEEYAESVGQSTDEAFDAFMELTTGQRIVLNNADKAFKTAGLSANAYMETVTSFSASLLQSLGGDTVAAAKLADQAIIDMSDNANKMGSSMESIQNAYMGFAKQNYTMLDNLKLGYGGTKEEMARLLNDAAKLNSDFAKSLEENGDSFANIVAAINIIQTEMGITGTTAKEASQTISGSIAAMKASWENLVMSIAGDGETTPGQYIDDFVDSVKTALGNLLPRVSQVFSGIGELVSGLAPMLGTEIPAILADVLPELLDAAILLVENLISGILTALPPLIEELAPMALMLVSVLLGMLPQVLDAAIQIVVILANGIAEAAPSLIPQAVQTVLDLLATLLGTENLQMLIDAAVALLRGLCDGIVLALPLIAEQAPVIISELVNVLLENLPMLYGVAVELILALLSGLYSSYPALISGMWDICVGVVDTIKSMDWEEIGMTLLETIAGGVLNVASSILDAINKAFAPAIEWISVNILKKSPTWGKDMIQGLIDGIKGMIGKVRDTAKNVAKAISDFLHFSRPETGPLRDYEQWMPDFIGGMAKGIEDNKYKLRNAVAGLASDMSADMTINANAEGSRAAVSAPPAIMINVYGAVGQDEETLADIVARKLGDEVSRKGAVFA